MQECKRGMEGFTLNVPRYVILPLCNYDILRLVGKEREMNAQSRDYTVASDGETARLIKAAAASAEPIRVDTGEAVYRVAADAEVAEDLPVPSAEEVAASIAGIKAAAGSWVGLVDAEELKTYLRARRKTANRPSLTR
jgi:hypothetical protein